jgi:hypothetical protein
VHGSFELVVRRFEVLAVFDVAEDSRKVCTLAGRAPGRRSSRSLANARNSNTNKGRRDLGKGLGKGERDLGMAYTARMAITHHEAREMLGWKRIPTVVIGGFAVLLALLSLIVRLL